MPSTRRVAYAERLAWYSAVVAWPDRSGDDLAVAWVVLDHLNAESGEAWPSFETISMRIGKSVRTVQRSVDRLQASGFLGLRRDRIGFVARFFLTLPSAPASRPKAYDGGAAAAGTKRLSVNHEAKADGSSMPGSEALALPATPDNPVRCAEAIPTLAPPDTPDSHTGQSCHSTPDNIVRYNLLKNLDRTFLAPTAQPQSSARPVGLPMKKAGRPASDRGSVEMLLADRFGKDGFEILFQLSERDPSRFHRLCEAAGRGEFDEAMLADARLAVMRMTARRASGGSD